MKKSLKYSVAAYGMAGLVLLSGCGTAQDTDNVSVDTSTQATVSAQEEVAVDAMTPEEMDDDMMQADVEAEILLQGDEELDLGATSDTSIDADVDATQDVSLDVPYSSPAGDHQFAVQMNITDGVVTSASATIEPDLEHPAVIKWQGAFVANFQAAVVGKSIDELQDVDAIGGASLATTGFKTAISTL